MNGIYHIEAYSANLGYEMTIKSKYTIITWDYATGKTEFYNMVRNKRYIQI